MGNGAHPGGAGQPTLPGLLHWDASPSNRPHRARLLHRCPVFRTARRAGWREGAPTRHGVDGRPQDPRSDQPYAGDGRHRRRGHAGSGPRPRDHTQGTARERGPEGRSGASRAVTKNQERRGRQAGRETGAERRGPGAPRECTPPLHPPAPGPRLTSRTGSAHFFRSPARPL